MIGLDVPPFDECHPIARAAHRVRPNRELDETERRARTGAREQDFQWLVPLRREESSDIGGMAPGVVGPQRGSHSLPDSSVGTFDRTYDEYLSHRRSLSERQSAATRS
jgi:hypothetical protein